MNDNFKSGFVAIVGRPNTGKSTLVNSLMKQKVVITSDKPQTTRHKIRCILNRPDAQIIFIDTPGLHKPHDLLGERLNEKVRSALKEVDVVIFVVDASQVIGRGDAFIAKELNKLNAPVILVLNKTDKINHADLSAQEEIARDLGQFKKIISISALNGDNLNVLIDETVELLPKGPKYYPDDTITDQPEKVIIAEFVREKVLELTREEVPYSVVVKVESISKRTDKDIVDVEAYIFVEKDSQKGIIIGKGGKMLKEIGQRAREEIENLLGSQIFLSLWVKVKKKWRSREDIIREMGY
ncbi:GTPase Era [Candidatus Oleimmundimicrobium sp.]|uniref:GTPase Era n=1 Tax=Candidatus Oleimmundimicrobium sp. TaxID=3060597 RepID=UPI0027189E31|nr:GTPase Era [Candidatus Oleimmundimicrobium sp.]MDO8885839.1 GTPase Era [Candidatus Oleimmundimicrobium sp.]